MEAFFDVAVLEKERRVMAVENAHGLVQVSTPAGTRTFDRLVACAGLQSDVVAKPVGARPSPAAVAVAGSIQHPVPAGAVREGCARLPPASKGKLEPMPAWNERRRTVRSEGAELAVFEYGPAPGPGIPTLLLVHGYPDDHRLYLPLIAELAATHHLIAYDTRNAGLSSVTGLPADFSLGALVEDLFAVLSATQASPVHLVGHDWGSIQGWAAVQDPRAAGRISGYTSISGADLAHVARWMRLQARSVRGWPRLLGQLLRSQYAAVFQIPVLPEAIWRLFLARCYERKAGRRVGDDPVRGLALYRANLPPKGLRPGDPVTVPVKVVVPTRDPFLSPHLVEGLESWVTDLTVIRVDAGHWWPATHPAELAGMLRAPRDSRQ